MARFFLPLAALLVGCSSPAAGPPDDAAGIDAAVDAIDPCSQGQVALDYFTQDPNVWPYCYGSYSDALANLRCTEGHADCGSFHVVGLIGNGFDFACYYDTASGALVAAWVFRDNGPSCEAGTAHDTCPGISWQPTGCDDGGMADAAAP